jgi:hypothetical protein
MLTATAVCRRSSSIKVRISINNLRGSWLFRSRISLRHPFTMFTGSFVTSWILGSNAPDGLEANFPVPSWVCPPVICATGCCTIAGDAMKEFGLIPLYRIWYYQQGTERMIFFRTAAGGEPVRDWLRSLDPVEDRKQIGVDIRTVEFGWPIGMPVCRPLGDGLYEVRSDLAGNKIGRVLFISTFGAGWFCFTASLRRHRKRRLQIWNWHERTNDFTRRN